MAHGGARKGAGRKPKADEFKARQRILSALKTVYSVTEDEEAIELFLIKFSETRDGQKFFAEHLLGKPTDVIEQQVSFDTESVSISFSKKE